MKSEYFNSMRKGWRQQIVHFSLFTLTFFCAPSLLLAQVGEYRNDFAIGGSAGVVLSSVSFVPEVPQDQLVGKTAGLTLRYVGEKYFNSICAVVAEVNYAQIGWKERIWDYNDEAVINPTTNEAEHYARKINYLQVPLLARMGWGRERRGFQFFFQVGPQLGVWLSESTDANFDLDNPNVNQRISHVSGPDITVDNYTYHYSNMYHKPVENKFDYGIAGGGGLEFSHPKVGHFLLEGRYYFGLGNIYGNSKRDYFSKSNIQNIVVKLSYLFDVSRTKNSKIK